jgi:tRNA threonylcarbamoyl adenosine modification protein (Sua5/YciO/YrdC/YwlC family)
VNKAAEKINIDNDENYALRRAVEIFKDGGLFIYPTDTIYGFGCNPFDESALKRLNDLKSREAEKQYIFLIDSIESLSKYCNTSNKTLGVLKKIWPAAVSVVLNLNFETKKKISYSTGAFRIPDNPFCLNLLNRLKSPIISTSVNLINEKPYTNGESIINSNFAKRVDAILYTSIEIQSQVSTVVDLTGKNPKVLREGQINFMELWEKFA